MIFVAQIISGDAKNSNETLFMVMSMAGLGYAVGTVCCCASGWQEIWSRLSPTPIDSHTEISAAEFIERIQLELERQIMSIDSSSVDAETKEDLKEAAKQAAVERISRALERSSEFDVDSSDRKD